MFRRSFRTETVIPNCTTLSLPVNGASGISISSDVSWNAVTSATGYFISIGITSDGTDIVNNQDVGNVTAYNPASDFPDDTEIFVTITPYNTAGSSLGCSEESFRTEVLIPICTRLTNPINGATNIALDAGISWNTIANATGYYVSIGTFSGGTDIANMLDVGNVTSFNPTLNFPDESDIFVTVIPYNSAGNATSCQEERFTTQAIIPVCTVITLPLTGAQDVPVDTNITWGFINNADGYRITIGTSSGSFDIENNLDVGRLNSYTPTNNFPDNATIYIKIIPYNSAGEALNCDEFSFTTENRVVVVPRFFTPNNDGFNDIWRVSDPRKEIKRIFIYDRYGKLLKTLADASVGWDGYISGKLLPTSDYWCVIEFYDKAPIRKHFTLKR
ncbi:hypothetical protein JCM19301_1896 [Jejuia pallidilutea]|uniref:Gliding motility-associated-like protein n=2 Tax=Jejuia pallidilutea TaxID=504487 RepID=A0A090VYX9_9FLAO|nr:hypothetical protein JCM19301_1896 [Jejuia pallidilutea]